MRRKREAVLRLLYKTVQAFHEDHGIMYRKRLLYRTFKISCDDYMVTTSKVFSSASRTLSY
jgi:hypothetical protein